MTLRDKRHTEIGTQRQAKRIDAGEVEKLSFPLPDDLSGGLHFADLVMRIGGKVENWGTAFFHVNPDCGITALMINHDRYAPGDTITLKTDIEGGTTGALLSTRFQLYDTYGRLLAKATEPVVGGTATWSTDLVDIRSHYLHAHVTLLKNGQSVDTSRLEIEVAYPQKSSSGVSWERRSPVTCAHSILTAFAKWA